MVLTDGTIAEHGQRIVWEQTDALPGLLRDHVEALPLWVDLRWTGGDVELMTLDRQEYLSAITRIVAKLRGRTPDEMISEELALHRRAVRIRNATVALLLLLLLTAIAAAVTVAWQARVAAANRNDALLAVAGAERRLERSLPASEAAREVLASGASSPEAPGLAVHPGAPPPVSQSTCSVGVVFDLAISANGDWLAAGGGETTLCAWDRAAIEHDFELPVLTSRIPDAGVITSVALSDTGTAWVGTGSNGVWSVELGSGSSRLLWRPAGREGRTEVADIALMPDGRIAVVSGQDVLLLQPEGAQVVTRRDTGAELVAVAANGSRLVTLDREGLLLVWSVVQGDLAIEARFDVGPSGLGDFGLPDYRTPLVLTPDGRFLATVGAPLPGDRGGWTVGEIRGVPRVFDLDLRQALPVHGRSPGAIAGLAFDFERENGLSLYTASSSEVERVGERRIVEWRIVKSEVRQARTLGKSPHDLLAVVSDPVGPSLFAVGNSQEVRRYSTRLPDGPRGFTAPRGPASNRFWVRLEFDRSGSRLLTSPCTMGGELWESGADGFRLLAFAPHELSTSVAVVPGDDRSWDPPGATIVTGGRAGVVAAWTDRLQVASDGTNPLVRGASEARAPTTPIRCGRRAIYEVATTSDGGWLAAAVASVQPAEEQSLPCDAPQQHGQAGGLLWRHDRDAGTWQLAGLGHHRRDESTWDVHSVTFSPDGGLLATGSKGGVRLWRVEDREGGELHQVGAGIAPPDDVFQLRFSPDGRRLAVADDAGSLTLWDVATQELLHVLRGHTDQVRGVAWHPDGEHVVSASADRTVRVWSVADGAQLLLLHLHDHDVFAVAFSTDTAEFATLDRSCEVVVTSWTWVEQLLDDPLELLPR